MKHTISKKEELIIKPGYNTLVRGKATTKLRFWEIITTSKNGEEKRIKVSEEDFGYILTEILNIREKSILEALEREKDKEGTLFGSLHYEILNKMKSYIKVVNRDTFVVINKNDDVILKTKKFADILDDLSYKSYAQDLSIEENIGF